MTVGAGGTPGTSGGRRWAALALSWRPDGVRPASGGGQFGDPAARRQTPPRRAALQRSVLCILLCNVHDAMQDSTVVAARCERPLRARRNTERELRSGERTDHTAVPDRRTTVYARRARDEMKTAPRDATRVQCQRAVFKTSSVQVARRVGCDRTRETN